VRRARAAAAAIRLREVTHVLIRENVVGGGRRRWCLQLANVILIQSSRRYA
jgi:hypothetical protein